MPVDETTVIDVAMSFYEHRDFDRFNKECADHSIALVISEQSTSVTRYVLSDFIQVAVFHKPGKHVHAVSVLPVGAK